MGRIYDATWGRAFAALYDRGLKGTEEAGLREMRREALAGASGRTIDARRRDRRQPRALPGGGRATWSLPSPTRTWRSRLRPKLVRRRVRARASSKRRPNACPSRTSSFDTAVFTLVLCTVPDPAAALAEAARILRPGGKLLFVEHVRAEDAGLARWQDRLEKPWRFLADGCHCNRDTVATIEASPLTLGRVEHGRLPKAPPLVRPLVRGSADAAPAPESRRRVVSSAAVTPMKAPESTSPG